MRLALLILSGLALLASGAGYLALVDVFDPIGTKMIFGVTMGLLLFATGLVWVFFIELHRNRKSLDKCSRFHTVSELLNRRETLKEIATQMKSARRHRHPYSILLIGMDGFGEINNRMGHRGGDIILKHVADRIRSVTRAEDISGHYEGDTFIVGASHADLEGVQHLAKRIMDKVTGELYKTRGVKTNIEVTISTIAAPPEEYDSEMLLFKLEDRLKTGKAEGGARIQSTD